MLDAHTGFVIREEQCTGCGMCLLACSSIKHQILSFSNAHSYVEVEPTDEAASFNVVFTDECDGCCYCLKFCAFDAIEQPPGWVKAPHLKELTRRS